MISSGSYATSVKFTIAIVTALRGIPMKNAKFLLLPSAFLLASCGAGIPDSSSIVEEASLDSSLPASSASDVSETPSESPSSEEKIPYAREADFDLVSYVGEYAPKYDSASIHMSLDFTALLEWSIEGSGETNRMTIQYEILPDYNFLFDFVADMFMIKKTEGVLPACFVASDVAGGVFSEDKTEVRFQSTRYVPDTDCSEGICYTFRLRE